MKNLIYSTLIILSGFFFTACERSAEPDLSQITYYVTIELEGNADMGWQVGTPFVDPGYSAELDGEDFTNQVVVNSTVDSDTPGYYTVSYTGTNTDGYSTTSIRNVFVYDLEEASDVDISGNYSSVVTRTTPSTGAVVSRGPYKYPITKIDKGLFYCPDLIGGYYWLGAGYGTGYAYSAYFTLNPDNSLEIVAATTTAWSDEGVFYKPSYYDPDKKQLYIYAQMSSTPTFNFDTVSTLIEE